MTTKSKKSVKKQEKFDFKTIESFEDACKKEGINTNLPDVSNIPEEFQKPIINGYKLMVIFKAINNGWKPDWNNYDEYKYFPWFEVLSSGFGFSYSHYSYTVAHTSVGSRLCTDTSEKALYIGKQFEQEYKEYLLYSE